MSTASQFSSKRQYHALQQSPAWSGTDWCAPENAHVLANRIKAYWSKRGKTVNVELFAAKANKGSNLHHFAIRSDMIGGRPRPSHPMVRP